MTEASAQAQTGAGGSGRGRSLRAQIVAWNILALALLLGVLGGVVRYTVRTTIMASVDRELERQTHPPPRRPPPGGQRPEGRFGDGPPPEESAPPGRPPQEQRPPQGGGPPGNDGPLRRDGGDPNPYRARFFDLRGRPRDPSGDATPWDAGALTEAALGEPVYTDVTVAAVPLRVLSHPIPPTGPPQGVVQAAYPLTDVRRAMAGVDRALLILIPVALVCAGLAGAALTDRVLARVRLMTQAAGRISGQNFDARLPVSGADEFSELAATFNGMLGRQEAAFRQQQRLIEQQRRFTADASHELKTPLTVIKGNTSMALSAPPDPAQFQQTLQEIDRAADTMRRLVQDLLLLARSDGGQLGRERVELPVREILERAASAVAHWGGAPVRLSVSDPALTVCGTEDELVRLFGNLLDNAARHTPPEAEITVEACRRGTDVVVMVADAGPGIAPEHLPHLGERFYRVDNARSRPDGGTGLGLSICRGIVEAHGGTLTFDSTLGVGTTVHVSLPAASSPSGSASAGKGQARGRRGRGRL